MMTGADLKAWRERVGWTQADLMVELEIGSRQTIGTWESAEKIPRLVELAIVALDQIEASRKRSGFEKQFTPEIIAAQRMKYWHQLKSDAATTHEDVAGGSMNMVPVWLCADGDSLSDGEEPQFFVKVPFSECLAKLGLQSRYFLCGLDRPLHLGKTDQLTGIRAPRYVVLKIQTREGEFRPGYYGLPHLSAAEASAILKPWRVQALPEC